MKYLLASIILSTLIPSAASAAGIQVSPAKLDFSVNNGAPASQNIIVVNPTADVQIYEVYADDFTQIVKPNPASFTLESGGKKTVAINVDSSALNNNRGQNLAFNLSVVGKPLADNKFSVGTGVKIPITVTVNAPVKTTNNYRPAYWIAALLIGLALLFKWFTYHKLKS